MSLKTVPRVEDLDWTEVGVVHDEIFFATDLV
jgi:hypothetical protein